MVWNFVKFHVYVLLSRILLKNAPFFLHTLSADILSKYLVCYGVYICKIQADT